MLFFGGISKKMNSSMFSFILILLHLLISFGRSDDISFSLCWVAKDNVLDRQNGNVWLNETSVKSIDRAGKLTSLTVSPAVETKLTLQYGGSIQSWTFKIVPSTRFTEIRGKEQPVKKPTSFTKSTLNMLSSDEVFACEHGTVFFHQDEHFFLAIGHTRRLPVKLESRTPSSLIVSWVENSRAVGSSRTVTLYHAELGSYQTLSTSTSTDSNYHFTALHSCQPYVACVEMAGSQSSTCLSTITDPDIPRDFKVSSWNSRSISLSWDFPEDGNFSLFLITAFFLNSTNHITKKVPLWHKKNNFKFTLSYLEPCSRVTFGLQAVCQAGTESSYSMMVRNDGNSGHSSIQTLRQTAFGSDNYTLSWRVSNSSSISMFRVYHQGALQGTTLRMDYTVGGLQPCKRYQTKVEALCGDSVIMSSRTIRTHTVERNSLATDQEKDPLRRCRRPCRYFNAQAKGASEEEHGVLCASYSPVEDLTISGPHGVSKLRYHSNDSTVQWLSNTLSQRDVVFLYELSLENGPTISSSRVSNTELHLTGLEEGRKYVLDVWEECDGQWESERAQLCFVGAHSSPEFLFKTALLSDLEIDISTMGLTMVLPWSLPEDLKDNLSEPSVEMGAIVKKKLQNLLKDFPLPARVDIITFKPADEPKKTEVLFVSFDASNTKEDVPLSAEDQLNFINSLKATNFTVADDAIHWNGPDLCASPKHSLCPPKSLCINTLGSYKCVCRHGYYDVSSLIKPHAVSSPHCNEKGLFSQCLDKQMSGGIAKPYLTSYLGGTVDVKLNDGRCTMEESEMVYYFHTSWKSSECGTERRVNKTHIEYHNTVAVSLNKTYNISRRDLKVVWKCVYPRHYVRNTQVGVDLNWLSSISLVQFNSSLELGLNMSLFTDLTYTDSYKHTVSLKPEDTLFLQVALQAHNSFASDLLLQVDSCWSTESANPEDDVQGLLLQDGCPVDHTLYWLSVNGAAQQSRFSVQMFTMPQRLPIYIHCLANICGHDEDCKKNCTGEPRRKRSVSQGDRTRKRAAVVSAGPLLVNERLKTGVAPSSYAEHRKVIFVVAGSIGFLGVTVLSVSATKAIMTYYERRRLQ